MNPPEATTLTIDQAVALMVNMDYIPDGFTLIEMLEAFIEEAETELENARNDSAETIDAAQTRVDACISRYNLCVSLKDHLQQETSYPEKTSLCLVRDDTGGIAITYDSLMDWAADIYGIGFPTPTTEKTTKVRWEQVTIKIRADYRIAWSYQKGKWPEKRFADIGLSGKRTQYPNHQGRILIDLSQKRRFPAYSSDRPEGKDKTAIHRLRHALKTLTGIPDDPFAEYNKHDGWKPRFKLIDATKDADRRAERETLHVPFDDTRSYADENDPAGQYLRDHDSDR